MIWIIATFVRHLIMRLRSIQEKIYSKVALRISKAPT
jgi:hypothetical protein